VSSSIRELGNGHDVDRVVQGSAIEIECIVMCNKRLRWSSCAFSGGKHGFKVLDKAISKICCSQQGNYLQKCSMHR